MEDIFISGNPLLESVGLHEPLVEELRAMIANAMHQAMVPLQAYAKEYRKYLELNNSDVATFLKYVRVCVCASSSVPVCVSPYTLLHVSHCP
jgi:hypothetical protein